MDQSEPETTLPQDEQDLLNKLYDPTEELAEKGIRFSWSRQDKMVIIRMQTIDRGPLKDRAASRYIDRYQIVRAKFDVISDEIKKLERVLLA